MMIDDEILKKHGLVIAAVYATIITNPTITHNEIAKCCCISVKSVKRALAELQQLHYIEIKVNKPHPNTYEVLHKPTNTESILTFGEFGFVHLTESELKKLQKTYPKIVIDDYIQRIDTFMCNNKSHKLHTYHTHYATIKLWIDGDVRQNGGYTTHRSTKTIDEIKHDEKTIETIQKIAEKSFAKFGNSDEGYQPSIWDIENFYEVSSKYFDLHKNLHDELIVLNKPLKVKVPREMCFGHASREYLEELQLKINPDTRKGSWGILTTDAMYYIEQYQKYYVYLDRLKEKAKTQSKEFLDYVGYHEGDE